MQNDIHRAFDHVRAGDELKEYTYFKIQEKIAGRKRAFARRLTVSLASLLLLVMGGFWGFTLYMTESAVLDIDVNPSIELTLNRFDRVIGVHAYNADGARVLERADIRHKSYRDALSVIVAEMADMGYLRERGLFTATLMRSAGDDGGKLEELQEVVDTLLATDPAVKQEVFAVDDTVKEHAHGENLSPAKYLAILELQQADPSVSIDACRDHSIGEIRRRAHSHQSGHGAASSQEEGEEDAAQEERDASSAVSEAGAHGARGRHGKHTEQK